MRHVFGCVYGVIPEGSAEREDTPNEGSTMHWGPQLKRKEKVARASAFISLCSLRRAQCHVELQWQPCLCLHDELYPPQTMKVNPSSSLHPSSRVS